MRVETDRYKQKEMDSEVPTSVNIKLTRNYDGSPFMGMTGSRFPYQDSFHDETDFWRSLAISLYFVLTEKTKTVADAVIFIPKSLIERTRLKPYNVELASSGDVVSMAAWFEDQVEIQDNFVNRGSVELLFEDWRDEWDANHSEPFPLDGEELEEVLEDIKYAIWNAVDLKTEVPRIKRRTRQKISPPKNESSQRHVVSNGSGKRKRGRASW